MDKAIYKIRGNLFFKLGIYILVAKIEINPSDPRYIKVIWGRGYKMEVQ